MPTFGGVTGRVYYKAWRGPAPRAAAIVFLHGFGEHSGLYHRLGNALNNTGIELWALDEIGHGLAGARLAEFAGARHDILNETVHREVAAAITEFVLNAEAGSAGLRPAASGHPPPAAQPAP